LPEDAEERYDLLGVDKSLMNEGEELLAMIEGGAIEEIRKD